MKRSAALCVSFLFFGAWAVGGDATKDDLKRLQGKWQFVQRVINGEKGDASGSWTFSGNDLLYGPGAETRAVLKIDATTKPKTFDFDHVGKDGKVVDKGILGIYEIDGDTLKICVGIPGKGAGRPKSFESKEGSGWTLTVLKRVKDE